MKLALPAAIALALTTSAFAQPPIDWTKPVTGIDGAIPIKADVIEQVIPVIIEPASGSTDAAFKPLDTPQPPPCDPPVARSGSGKPPPLPAPCSPPPR